MKKAGYPFSAVVGQEALKRALLLALVNPAMGGVLIVGQKGTAKSTIVRSLENIGNRKICTVPLSVTEDRLLGSIQLEKTLETGQMAYEPGLLQKADGQILYVDEVNLLQDQIADILLCAHGSGGIGVEREGFSRYIASRFLLIGTMNPEEGQLRPHFLDQFGICTVISTENSAETRLEIVKRRMEYEKDPCAFTAGYEKQEEELVRRIRNAAELLPRIQLSEENRMYIAAKCLEAGVQGHRGDLAAAETARAVAALEGRTIITEADIDEAAYYALVHRRKNSPPGEHEKEETDNREIQEDAYPEEAEEKEPDGTQSRPAAPSSEPSERREDSCSAAPKEVSGKERIFRTGESFRPVFFGHSASRQVQKGYGKRTTAKSAGKMGHYLYASQSCESSDIALDATIRAAAPHQLIREKGGKAIAIEKEDLRGKVRQKKYANLLVFVVDASGSMGAGQRMTETKGAILALLQDAYIKRDKICLITFRGQEARVLLPPTRSVERGVRLLEEMPTGGRTPLNAGLSRGMQVINSELRRQPDILPYMIVVTDGKGNVSLDAHMRPKQELMEISCLIRENKKVNTMVLDIEKPGRIRFGLAEEMAHAMGAAYQKIETLKSDIIVQAVERLRGV